MMDRGCFRGLLPRSVFAFDNTSLQFWHCLISSSVRYYGQSREPTAILELMDRVGLSLEPRHVLGAAGKRRFPAKGFAWTGVEREGNSNRAHPDAEGAR